MAYNYGNYGNGNMYYPTVTGPQNVNMNAIRICIREEAEAL